MAINPDGQLTILYVEDERETRENLSEIIAHIFPDVRLVLADNGAEGLESFKLYRADIVITDLNMPITNGLKMAAEIKTMSPATEIIALTAYSNTNYLLEAIETGISHYLLKPIDIKKIVAAIGKVLALIRSDRVIAHQNEVILGLNAELAQKAADLESANQDLQSFNYTVAHDLRSPLVNINGFSQLLLTTHASKLNAEGKRHLEVISREITRMNKIIDALLKFSLHAQQYLVKKPCNLTEIVQEIRDTLLSREPGRQVSFSIAQGVNGYCDPELLRIALENLLGNAWKFSANKEQARVEFGTINKEEDLVYFVRDNGAGFDQQESGRMFVPFQRLHWETEFEGMGIGLATVAKIIQRHGGRIWAEGEKGEGATFYFTL